MIVYVVGTHGAGKTMFSCKAAPDAEVCFHVPVAIDESYEEISDLPWVTIRVREGQRVQPDVQAGTSLDILRHDFSERDLYRSWADIPRDASVVRVSADGFQSVVLNGMSIAQEAEAMQILNDRLESRFDVVIQETNPRYPPREQDRVVSLSVPYAEIRRRQTTRQWDDRLDLGRIHYVEAARKSAQPHHPDCHGAKSYSRLWWATDRWCPVEEVAADRIKSLGNWYHPHTLAGIYSTDAAVESYEGRWRALSTFFDHDLTGTRLLDIGANSGFNALHLAERGATVVAVEPASRVIEQFRAVVEMGPYPMDVTDRIQYLNRAVETFDVGELGQFDTVVMSACHYYINRSINEPFKHPEDQENQMGVRGLRTTLWAVWDTIRHCSNRLLIPTNRAHADREIDPYPDADPKWIKAALEALGYHSVTIHAGYWHTPIVEAFCKKPGTF